MSHSVSPAQHSRNRRTAHILALGLGLAAATAGCSKAPKGQVVAVVNGQDVTMQDLQSEARAAGPQGSQDRQQVLQRVIARILLAQSAHTRKLDQYPGFPSDMQRIEQTALAQRALQGLVTPNPNVSPAEVSQFMAAHPYTFRSRERLKLDEIKFSAPGDLKGFENIKTANALSERLRLLGVPIEHASQAVDTATLPQGEVEKLNELPPGELFFVHQGDTAFGDVIVGRDQVNAPEAEQTALATQMLKRIKTAQQVDAEVKRLASGAKIAYQPGFAPQAGAAKAPGHG